MRSTTHARESARLQTVDAGPISRLSMGRVRRERAAAFGPRSRRARCGSWSALMALAFCLATGSALAQTETPAAAAKAPKCAFQPRDYPDYILWTCNREGTAHANTGVVLWTRTNGAGAEVLSEVWKGPLEQLATGSETIINAHRRSHSRCVHYFHLAATENRTPAWNRATRGFVNWMRNEARVRFPELCYVSQPAAADFIIVWGTPGTVMPWAFTVDIPTSSPPASAQPVAPDPQGPTLAQVGSRAVTLSVYRVETGFDGSIVRLGLSLFSTTAAAETPLGAEREGLRTALQFVAAQTTQSASLVLRP